MRYSEVLGNRYSGGSRVPWKPLPGGLQTAIPGVGLDPGWEASREAQTAKKRLSRKRGKNSVYMLHLKRGAHEHKGNPAAFSLFAGLGQNAI
jgi:hypothetical protein